MTTTEQEPSAARALRQHYSGLTLHRRCPQAWHYKYEERLEKPGSDLVPARDFGTWWHALMAAESIERGRERDSLKSLPRQIRTVDGGPTFDPETVVAEDVLIGAERWWEKLPHEQQEEWSKWLGADAPGRLRYMLARWQEEHADEIAREQPLGVEVYWERDLPTKEGPTVRLFGFIDEVYFDERRRMVVVRDHKTSTSLSAATTIDDMMDSQLQLYAWGISPTVAKWDVGQVRAISYDRLASVAPKTPVLTQAGGLSKQITRFDLHTYVEWAAGPDGNGQPYPGRKKDGSGAGLYTAEPEVIERLSSVAERASWLTRTLTPLNMNLVKAHLRAAVDTAEDVGRTMERTAVHGEAARNLATQNCKWCDYSDLCRAQMFGGPKGEYIPEEYGLRVRPAR